MSNFVIKVWKSQPNSNLGGFATSLLITECVAIKQKYTNQLEGTNSEPFADGTKETENNWTCSHRWLVFEVARKREYKFVQPTHEVFMTYRR